MLFRSRFGQATHVSGATEPDKADPVPFGALEGDIDRQPRTGGSQREVTVYHCAEASLAQHLRAGVAAEVSRALGDEVRRDTSDAVPRIALAVRAHERVAGDARVLRGKPRGEEGVREASERVGRESWHDVSKGG